MPIKGREQDLNLKHHSISQLKVLFSKGQITDNMIETLKRDERKGVQQLIRRYEREQERMKRLEKQFTDLQWFDHTYYNEDNDLIAGVDEAGRGPLAGPVVAAAVILPPKFKLLGLTDSKQVSEPLRQAFYNIIVKEALCYHVSVIDNQQIDDINIFEATKHAMINSVHNLEKEPHHVLIDAVDLAQLKHPSSAIIKGDQKSLAIAAASILAKVMRDRLMGEIHEQYPVYKFASNMGYGTKYHLEMIKQHGVTPYHRKTFAPIKEYVD